jgi:hypothetical protein
MPVLDAFRGGLSGSRIASEVKVAELLQGKGSVVRATGGAWGGGGHHPRALEGAENGIDDNNQYSDCTDYIGDVNRPLWPMG